MIRTTFDMTTDEKFDYLTEIMMKNFDRVDKGFIDLENKMNTRFFLLEEKIDKRFEIVDTDLSLIKNSLNLIINHLEIKSPSL